MKQKLILLSIPFLCCSCFYEREVQENETMEEKVEEISQSFCSYQDESTIGIGLLLWNGDCDAELQLFDNSKLEHPKFQSSLCETINGICPFFFKQDYGIFHFVVLEKLNDCYLVSYNGGKDQGYIPINPYQKFVTWNSFLKENVISVREKGNLENFYKIISVNGNSLKVKDENNVKKEIIWTANGKLLVRIILLM